MGLKVRYFMPPHSVAPLAFYFTGDLLSDYTNLELISTISTMETFQKIYRPEIYNANSVAGKSYQPSLKHQDYSLTRIVYDREERSRLAIEQGSLLKSNLSNHTKRFLSSGLRITLLINQHIGHLLWKSYYRLQLLAAYRNRLGLQNLKSFGRRGNSKTKA